MIRSANSVLSPPRYRRRVALHPAREIRPVEPHFSYGRAFWLAYAANVVLLTGVALLFRYADFVTLLGGSEFHLGWIVGIGMVGSMLTRLVLGSWIDRYGTRLLWISSLLLFAVTCFAHLAIASHTGVAVYLLRISYCCAAAGINGASMTFISTRGPTQRIAELVGMLGTAGFLGMTLGTLLGDFLLGSVVVQCEQVVAMFVIAGLLGMAAMPFAWAATRMEQGPHKTTKASSLSLIDLLRCYHPGFVLVVGVAMGMGLGLPTTFLRTYATELGIPRIGMFFTVYCVTAIITRFLTRHCAERFGTRPIILLGMSGMVFSLTLFLLVQAEWQLVFPALMFGCSHAILFPSLVAAGSSVFPRQNRGLGTVLMLATWDMGLLIGSPTAGAVLRYSEFAGLPPYPTMFLTIAGLLAAATVGYAITSRNANTAVPT